jgi:endonuclease/exonuclease/phosphatase family metal-dependent hydrolase
MRVATLNLWGTRGDWEQRRERLRDGFRALQPDLVAFQEAIVTPDYDQVRDILGDGFQLAHHSDREADGQGISIASRLPLGDLFEVDLNLTPRTGDFACSTLIAEAGDLLFVNHLPSWQLDFERERELQAATAAVAIEERLGDRHVVVCGDFDADPDAASVRFWTGRQSLEGHSVCYRDAWESAHPGEPGHTFTPENPLVADPDWPFRQIDHILVRCDDHGGPTLQIRDCRRIFDDVPASDHFGLLADVSSIS